MARQRILKPEFFQDEELATKCSAHARLLFEGLWTLADKRGRLRDQPPVIHGAIFPYEPQLKVPAMLEELQRGGFVIRYEIAGKKYIQVRTFEKHQKPHPKETESTIPAPPDGVHPLAVKLRGSAVESNGRAGRFLPESESESESESVLESESESVPESESDDEAPRHSPPEPGPEVACAPRPEARMVLENVRQRLRGIVPQRAFDTWFRPITAAHWDGGTFVIEAPNEEFRQWVRTNYQLHIRGSLDAIGLAGVPVTVETARPPTEAELAAAVSRLVEYRRERMNVRMDKAGKQNVRMLLLGGDSEDQIRTRWDAEFAAIRAAPAPAADADDDEAQALRLVGPPAAAQVTGRAS